MPRKPRIEIPGYYHVLNRGVEQRAVFLTKDDYYTFIDMMCEYADRFDIEIDNYCLMSNHYHILLKIIKPTLSKYMKELGMQYAVYFNNKYNRSGHLWQGRFKSWYITNEIYLYSVMRYIEQNPLKANMVKELKNYPYNSYYYFINPKNMPNCLRGSKIVQDYGSDVAKIEALLSTDVDINELKEIKKASSLIEAPNIDIELDLDRLKEMFEGVVSKAKRDKIVVEAHKLGYSQHKIAKVLGLSQPTINRIIKRYKEGVL